MTQWLLLGAVTVWLLALTWIVQDAYASFSRGGLMWWGAVGLMLGPFAVPLYLSERLTRRAETNKIGHGRDAFTVPDGRRPFRDGGQRRFADIPSGGSGVFVVVGTSDATYQSVEVPSSGALIVRRAVPGEYSRAGVLVLHDEAVSRDEHCRLWLANGRVMVADHSRWGTIVDDKRIQGTTVSVEPGTLLRVGQTDLTIRRGGN